MADAKITELTELTTPALGDVIAIVDDPGGSPVTKKMALSSLVIDDDTMATASATNVPTSESTKAYVDNGTWLKDSMSRQAIINGNFDVWQRGTSLAIATTTVGFLADRWRVQQDAGGGTLPTLTHSRQSLTPGDVSNSFFHYRIATNGAGTSLGVNSFGVISQTIENGTRYLCGNGKKVTVSFWARSDIANKKLGISLNQGYGSGGSPTATEYIAGSTISITSSWTKYTVTFTTNTLSGKTFGTANDDSLELVIWQMWGATLGGVRGLTGSETYVGSGNIDIAQVQLCAGDVALPFMPKSFEEELRACQRYYQKFGGDAAYQILANGQAVSTTVVNYLRPLLTKMRVPPVGTYSGSFQTTNASGAGVDVTLTDNQFFTDAVFITGTVASGLTAGDSSSVFTKNSTAAYIAFSSEL